jgi:hypothetical protein
MLIDQISRIPEFSHIDPAELVALSRRVRILCIPQHRWLAQREKNLQTYFYLLKGTVCTNRPKRRVRHTTFGALNHFYPGCAGARTESVCQILLVDADQRDFLMKQTSNEGESAQSEAWLAEFLSSNNMRELSPLHWRAVLRSFASKEFEKSESVIQQGEQSDYCLVIEKGHAAVHRAGRTLGYLNPGDFFGEDSLILNAQRNAHVTALENMVVCTVSKADFERWIVHALVQPVAVCGAGKQLSLDKGAIAGAQSIDVLHIREQIDDLDVKPTYYIVGGCSCERYLAAFILTQKDIRAHPLES